MSTSSENGVRDTWAHIWRKNFKLLTIQRTIHLTLTKMNNMIKRKIQKQSLLPNI